MKVLNINNNASFGRVRISKDRHTQDVITNYGMEPEYKKAFLKQFEQLDKITGDRFDVIIVGHGMHNIRAIYKNNKTGHRTVTEPINTFKENLQDIYDMFANGFFEIYNGKLNNKKEGV